MVTQLRICCLCIIFLFIQCSPNEKPAPPSSDFSVSLKKLYDIELFSDGKYNIPNVTFLEVDVQNNLLVVSFRESVIVKFDSIGNYITTLGGKGQGPKELDNPYSVQAYKGQYYIYELHKGIKIWDSSGNYISYHKARGYNGVYKPYEDIYIGLSRYDTRENGGARYNLSTYSLKGEKINNIVDLFGNFLKKEFYGFYPTILAVDSDRSLYFPVSRDEYLINKYDIEGNLLHMFGREYERNPYSEEIKKNYYSERRIADIKRGLGYELPVYPPIVRHILVDDSDYIWVIAGEYNDDNWQTEEVTSTIDIFDKEGNFLYTFQSPYFTRKSIIKNGRLYSSPTSTENQVISVYEVTYNTGK